MKFFDARRKNVTNLKPGVGGGGVGRWVIFDLALQTAQKRSCTVLDNRQ
jgi:hypothetical protein